jgi:uncharacterized damage-inducible protein DinB
MLTMNVLTDLTHECRRHKDLADKAMAQLGDAEFFRRPGELVNPVALIVKHLAGNLTSRWTDFLTSDGEKPCRDRDGEFRLTEQDTRDRLLAAWEAGWKTLFDAITGLKESDLGKTVLIRGEPHTAHQALLRGLTHAAYHVGQITYLTRLLRPESTWLTIAPGQSRGHQASYRQL